MGTRSISAGSTSAREAASAANRFGMGARPGELAQIGDPRGWLDAQLRGDAAASQFAVLPSSLDYLRDETVYFRERIMQRGKKKNAQAGNSPTEPRAKQQKNGFREVFGDDLLAEIAARYRVAASSNAGFTERLVRFWSNHFAISADKRAATLYAAPMEREAIRPHVFGRYSDLLLAVETHPGMLRYLDNVRSVGENSKFAQQVGKRGERMRADGQPRKREVGLNENLAREILELHTLGVNGGYSQADVTELARGITGWGVPMARGKQAGNQHGTIDSAFVFREAAHEAGARNVLGRRYAEGGVAQGRAILTDLAVHPATARHLAYKLARHFVSDTPSPALVERLANAYRSSEGDLPTLYRALIRSPEAWGADARKFKSPDDFLVSAVRAGSIDPGARPQALVAILKQLGQPVFTPRSPAGFPDTARDWTGPDALWKRIQVAQSLSERVQAQRVDAKTLADSTLGPAIDADTRTAIRRAGSPRDGLALLFASPDFQWRT